MTTPKSITIDGTEYLPAAKVPNPGDLSIVILQRGRVVVGNLTIDGDWATITNAQCVRYWGTTRGLGEIASGGPTSKTKLDPQPTTRAHVLTLVEIIACEPTQWA